MRRLEPLEATAVGFRLHTGWAVAVAVTSTLRVLDRRRLTLVEETDHDAVFVYHAAAELSAAAAERLVAKARGIAQARAASEMSQLLSDLAANGHSVWAVGLPRGPQRPLPSFRDILRSHPIIHAAEGQLFRSALSDACAKLGLPVVGVSSKELLPQAAQATGLRPAELKRRLDGLGRTLGPPWAKDQKEAALAALIAGGASSTR